MNDDLLRISLNQGKQFKNYQNKIKNSIIEVSNGKSNSSNNKNKNKREGLTNLGNTNTNTNTSSTNQQQLDELQQLQNQFQVLSQQYNAMEKYIEDSSLVKINRTSSSNPYLNKTIRFTTGHLCYVTSQGVAKYIPSTDILNTLNIPKDYIDVNIPWSTAYDTPGTIIPTNPSLISGTPVVANQTLSNAGINVYASRLIDNPSNQYIGCYNDKPESTTINIVPTMNSSNMVNGFTSSASSIYLQNNDKCGPWGAFDQNPDVFWHSASDGNDDIEQHKYNSTTGVYEGTVSMSINTPSAGIINVGGEYVQISMPNAFKVNQYSLATIHSYNHRCPNSWYIIGSKDGQWFQVDRQIAQDLTGQGGQKTYSITNPDFYTAYAMLIDKVGRDDITKGRDSVKVSEWNLYINSDDVLTDDKRAMIPSSIGYTTFDACQTYAVDNGYKYFGLQDYKEDGTASCSVSNDDTRLKIYGDASINVTAIPLWSSNTAGSDATSAYISSTGQLVITNSGGTILWQSPNAPEDCVSGGNLVLDSLTATYGANCNDSGFSVQIGNATDKVKSAFTSANNPSQFSFPINNSSLDDPAKGCKKSWDASYQCGNVWKSSHIDYAEGQNYIFDCSQEVSNCTFFLIAQLDGTLCLWRGTDPTNRMDKIWCTSTSGQQKNANPDWVSSYNKFGRNYLKMGESLGLGEWISSTDGTIKLIMQTDGNLVLYASDISAGCSQGKDGKVYGSNWINAVYQLSSTGNKDSLGKVGYIDSDDRLRDYPSSMLQFSNTYQLYQNTDSAGNDITSINVGGQDECQNTCSNNTSCAAFVYQGATNMCWIKDSNAYPRGERQNVSGLTLGVRRPLIPGSKTCSNQIADIDTIQYDNYAKGDAMYPDVQCNPQVVSDEDRVKFDEIKNNLANLGGEIASKMESLYAQDNKIYEKMNMNFDQFKKNLAMYININKKIRQELEISYPNNIEGMLNMNDVNGMVSDTDLKVLQENYRYIFWSILAVGILTITINVMKK